MAFPAAPTNGDIHLSQNGSTYVYQSVSTTWTLLSRSRESGFVHAVVGEDVGPNSLVLSASAELFYNSSAINVTPTGISSSALRDDGLLAIGSTPLNTLLDSVPEASPAEIAALSDQAWCAIDVTDPAVTGTYTWRKAPLNEIGLLQTHYLPGGLLSTNDIFFKNGLAMSETLVPTLGTAPYVYSIVFGTVPTGTAFTPATGVVAGTPSVNAEVYDFILRATDADGNYIDQRYTGIVDNIGYTGTGVVIEQYFIGTSGWTGLTIDDDGNFVALNYSNGRIHQYDGKSTVELQDFASPTSGSSNGMNGLDMVGGNLISLTNKNSFFLSTKMYEHVGVSAASSVLNNPGKSSQGMAHDGTDYWVSRSGSFDYIQQHDGSSNTILSTLSVAGQGNPQGIVYDGANLIIGWDDSKDTTVQVGVTNVVSLTIPNSSPSGLAFDGQYLYAISWAGVITKYG